MTPSLEIEPGSHWWEATALTTRPRYGQGSCSVWVESVGPLLCSERFIPGHSDLGLGKCNVTRNVVPVLYCVFLSFHEIDGYKFGHSALTKRRLLFPTGERQIADQMTIYKHRRGVAIGCAENKPSRRRVNGVAMNQILSPAPKSLA